MSFSGRDAVGVTGLPCSGKSFAAELLASGEIDGERRLLLKADDIGHELLLRDDVLRKVRARFGADVTDAGDPAAVRRRIAERVFGKAADLEWLEQLIHPLVTEEMFSRIQKTRNGTKIVIESALLFKAGLDAYCGRILVIEANQAVRTERAAERGWTENKLRGIDALQIPFLDTAIRTQQHNIVRVDNSASVEELRAGLSAALTCGNAHF
jgi:dephospho-CoA kinase